MEFNATLLVSAISFIVFVLIMNQILYKPIERIVQERQDYLAQNDAAVLEHNTKAQSVLDEKNAKLSDTHKKAKDTIFAELESSKNLKTQVLQERKTALTDKVKVQKDEISNEKAKLEPTILAQTEDLSEVIAAKILEGKGGSDV